MAIVQWADQALHALFAPPCAACLGPLGPGRVGPVCRECWRGVRVVSPPWCDRCGEPLTSWRQGSGSTSSCVRCRAHPPHFDRARAFGLYEGPLRQIIHALKYRRLQSLGPPLGLLMRQADDGLLAGADAVVPVPLHPWRRLRRGFNQSEELARELGLPVWRPLRRWSLGVPQAGLSADLRQANVRDAYTLKRRWTGVVASRPRRVVLIDDVMTTGATLEACSLLLREAGVEWIGALTAARAATLSAPRVWAARPPQQPLGLHPSAPRR